MVLCWYAVIGDVENVGQLLMNSDIDIDAVDDQGATPFHFASQYGHLPVVQLLHRHGANVNVLTKNDKYNALDLAAQNGHDNVVSWLLDNTDIDIHAQDSKGGTAAHSAALLGHSTCVDLLLQAGVDVDCQEKTGHTVLHNASQCGNMETVTTILRYNPTLLFTPGGYSALHQAAGGNNYQVVETLVRDYGWDVDTVSRNKICDIHWLHFYNLVFRITFTMEQLH